MLAFMYKELLLWISWFYEEAVLFISPAGLVLCLNCGKSLFSAGRMTWWNTWMELFSGIGSYSSFAL